MTGLPLPMGGLGGGGMSSSSTAAQRVSETLGGGGVNAPFELDLGAANTGLESSFDPFTGQSGGGLSGTSSLSLSGIPSWIWIALAVAGIAGIGLWLYARRK